MDLTSKRLAGVPKRNSAAFISDYLHSQRPFHNRYAAEGLAVVQALDAPLASTQRTTSPGRGPTPDDDFLLGTPLLKPRVAPTRATNPGKKEAATPDKEKRDGLPHTGLQMPDSSKGNANQASAKKADDRRKAKIRHELKKPKAKTKTKDTEALGSAHHNEHARRLEDRRDRKRIKKTIMQPPQKTDSDKENSECNNTKIKKTRGTKHKAQPKGHATLAFMHGFPSTNVGKHRITVEPLLRTVGVFKKGKASFASQTIDKAKKQGNICFSESQFFKNAGAKHHKRKREPSPSPSSSSDASDNCVTKPRKTEGGDVTPTKAQLAKPREAEASSSILETDDSQDDKATRKPYDPADSIVWDIERESYIEDHATTGRQGTVVVSLPQFRPDAGKNSRTDDPTVSPLANQSVSILQLDPPSEMDCMADAPDASILSLRPSESASRVASKNVFPPLPSGNAQSVLMVSKFFRGGTVTRDKPPVVSAKVSAPAPSLVRPSKSAGEFPRICDGHQSTPSLKYLTEVSPEHISVPEDNDTLLEYPDSFLWPAGSFEDPWDVDEEKAAQELEYVPEHIGSELADSESFVWPADSFAVDQQEYEEYVGADGESTNYEQTLDVIDYDQTSNCGYYHPNSMDMDGHEDELEGLEGFNMHGYIEYPSRQQLEFAELQSPFLPVDLTEVDDLYGSEGSLMSTQSLPNESACSQYPSEVLQDSDDILDDDVEASGLEDHVDRFAQGRALLYGLPSSASHSFHEIPTVEAEVADLLRQSHWTPQRL